MAPAHPRWLLGRAGCAKKRARRHRARVSRGLSGLVHCDETLLSTVRTPSMGDASVTMPHHCWCGGSVRAHLGEGVGAYPRAVYDEEDLYPDGGACASRR